MKKLLLLTGIATAAFLVVGCEDDEMNDMAKAQQCLDGISSSNYAAANDCINYIAQYDTPEANIIKCSAKILSGGLTTEKMVNAYKNITDGSVANRETAFIAVLALDPSSRATEAKPYCARSGQKSLIYISNLAVVGSLMAENLVLGGGNYDPTDPESVPTPAEVAEILTDCQPPATCNGSHEAIGTSIVTLSSSYCTGNNATNEICTMVNSAIAGAGGDNEVVSKQLFCLLGGQTYDSIGDACI